MSRSMYGLIPAICLVLVVANDVGCAPADGAMRITAAESIRAEAVAMVRAMEQASGDCRVVYQALPPVLVEFTGGIDSWHPALGTLDAEDAPSAPTFVATIAHGGVRVAAQIPDPHSPGAVQWWWTGEKYYTWFPWLGRHAPPGIAPETPALHIQRSVVPAMADQRGLIGMLLHPEVGARFLLLERALSEALARGTVVESESTGQGGRIRVHLGGLVTGIRAVDVTWERMPAPRLRRVRFDTETTPDDPTEVPVLRARRDMVILDWIEHRGVLLPAHVAVNSGLHRPEPGRRQVYQRSEYRRLQTTDVPGGEPADHPRHHLHAGLFVDDETLGVQYLLGSHWITVNGRTWRTARPIDRLLEDGVADILADAEPVP